MRPDNKGIPTFRSLTEMLITVVVGQNFLPGIPMEIPLTLTRDSETIIVFADAEYIPGSRGYRNSMGVPEEPDEDPEWEVETFADEDGNEIELADEEVDSLYEQLQGIHPDDYREYYCD